MNLMNKIEIRELTESDLVPDLLEAFNRYQEVVYVWRTIENKKVLVKNPFTENWDSELKREVVAVDLTNCIKGGGAVFGAFHESKLIAFATLLHDFFGSRKQYLQLIQLHTSYEYRHFGLGKQLFKLCADKAKSWGAEKLYISTHSAEESQRFYKAVGCRDAEEIDKKIAEHEPYDCQLEYLL